MSNIDIDIDLSRHLLGALRVTFARKKLSHIRLVKDAWLDEFHPDAVDNPPTGG